MLYQDLLQLELLDQFSIAHGAVIPVQGESNRVLRRPGRVVCEAQRHLQDEDAIGLQEVVEVAQLLQIAPW